MLGEMSTDSPSEAEDLTPYGALSVPVQRRLVELASPDGESVLVAPSGLINLNLAPYGALSDRVQLRLSQGYAGYAALPPRLSDEAVLVEASRPATNPRFSPGIQSQPALTPYGALAGAQPLNF